MKILAIESSCDETACAVIEDGRRIISNIVASQIDLHTQYGGVIPELAAREHLTSIAPVTQAALEAANMGLSDIDAFAATIGPGLIGSLLVGVQAAKTLAFMQQKPFIGVHHLQAHVASTYLESDLAPPFLCLLVSGGHTQLLHVVAYDEMRLLGETLDDAVGEAYDKVARLMGLGYPGGPKVDKLAYSGNEKAFVFPQARCQNEFDFSYSGLKTAVLKTVEKFEANAIPLADVAASFQRAAVAPLLKKTLAAAEKYHCDTIAIAGGVAANSALRQSFETACGEKGLRLFVPQLAYCTDNAAMVGSAAFFSPFETGLQADVFSRKSHIL